MDTGVPLVVPEINAADIKKNIGIIANPNCSTIQLVMVLKPIMKKTDLKRIIISTYQSVSGTGKNAVQELFDQTNAIISESGFQPKIYPHQIGFNVLPHIDVFEENDYTKEEMKLVNETRKILHVPDLQITPTAVRVPVIIGHSESVYIETAEPLEITELKELLNGFPGVKVLDDPLHNIYPLPVMSKLDDNILVGRIRKDLTCEKGLNLWIVGNNLRKGAALNAVQIAECVIGNCK